MRLVLVLIILSLVSCRNFLSEPDIGMTDFLRRNHKSHFVILGTISNITKKKYSESFYQIKSLLITSEKNLGSYPKGQVYKAIECAIISDLSMIAPFEQQILDKPLNLKEGERVVVYLGIDGSLCEIIHLSKVEGSNIVFPAYKKQEELKIPLEKFERLVESGFKLHD